MPLLLVRFLYLGAAALLLLASLLLLRGASPVEGPAQVLVFGMMILTFPIGVLAVLGWAHAAVLFGTANPDSSLAVFLGAGTVTSLATLWLVLALLGYFQWFVLLPTALRWWQDRRRG